jgi:hypothetical protein
MSGREKRMHYSEQRGELKKFVPGDTLFDFQDEALDSADGAIGLGGPHVVFQQKEKLVVILAILAD